jgi:predicted metal-dependent hydrolase
MNTVKAAEKRIREAETLLQRASDEITHAQAKLSVIVGLRTQCADLRKIQGEIKACMYRLQVDRESGCCDLDSVAADFLAKQQKKSRVPRT